MAPETVEVLSPETRARLHHMAWVDAQLSASRMPVVPPAVRGAPPADSLYRMNVARWRDWLDSQVFPPDEVPS